MHLQGFFWGVTIFLVGGTCYGGDLLSGDDFRSPSESDEGDLEKLSAEAKNAPLQQN